MIEAPKPANESERLNALWASELLDTKPEDAFDAMTKLAAHLCRTPIAIISLVDADRQWFKSQCGMGSVTSTGRDIALCAHAILHNELFEVPDTSKDPRFADNPMVTGPPHIRFYAGMPLIEPGGTALGTLCVIDRKPRRLTHLQKEYLERLAQAVVGLIATRIRRSELEEYQRAVAENKKAHAHYKERTRQLRAFARRHSTP